MTKTVLIVEDNPGNMRLFQDVLEGHGYDTLQTATASQALKLARKHRPDVIVMDIQLPGISGLEATKWIKTNGNLKSIPIIAVTAFASKEDEQMIRKAGCDAYLAKPISVEEFLKTVARFVEEPALPSPKKKQPVR
jgi:two-component system cell cycle response regulator DivK